LKKYLIVGVIVALMANVYNPNLLGLHKAFTGGKSGMLMEGSSRSGKTYSSIDFLVWLSTQMPSGTTTNIIKETFASFKTTLYRDFNKRLPQFGISSPFAEKHNVNSFKLWDNQINLLSADNESVYSGVGSDIFWVNESLDISQQVHDQSEQRCQRFWWHDYNPKVTEHWVYDRLANRSDVQFLKTTFLDNPHISAMEKRKILSYEPNAFNIKEGTADDYMWNVYGLGLRSAPEGLIFQHVEWIDKMPPLNQLYYAMDFGSVDPTVLVVGGKKDKNAYYQKIFSEPTDNPDRIIELLVQHEISKKAIIHADSASAGNISYLRRKGWMVIPTAKIEVVEGIGIMKNYKTHIVEDREWRKEQTGYKYRTINGKNTGVPLDAFNHCWDCARYIAVANFI